MKDTAYASGMSTNTMTTDHAPLTTAFLLGGHAYFTVANGAGEHYSFRVSAPKEQTPDTQRPVWFVALLTGPDNTADYTYMGIIVPGTAAGDVRASTHSPLFRLTGKSTHTDDSKPVKVLRWAIGLMVKGQHPAAPYSIQHMGRCAVCGRALTDPESIRLGIGPKCRGDA